MFRMNLTKSLVDNITDALFIVDSSHKVVYANTAIKDVIGKEPGEIINNYCYNVFTSELCFKGCPFNYVSESRTSFTKLYVKIYDDAGNIKEVNYMAFPYRDEMIDGIAVTLRSSNLPFQPIELVTKDYDYLPHKRRFFNELLQQVSDGVIMVDKSFNIIEFNSVAEHITGFKKEEVYGQPCPNLCSFAEDFSCPFEYSLKTKHDELVALTNIIRKNGEPVVAKVKLKILKDDSGNIIGGLALLKNVVSFVKSRRDSDSFMSICGESKQMKQVYDFVKAAAISKSSVLISGEAGVEKDLIAQAIHSISQYSDEPFIKINCAVFPDNLLDGELFGYENGQHYGSDSYKEGKLEMVKDGTVVLNEINETSLTFQAKLLRVLEEGVFERVGGKESIKFNGRIIVISNVDLKKETQKGNFREDLYYRLNTIQINIPPLRERLEDLPPLCDYFLKETISANNNKLNKKLIGFSDAALEVMKNYSWHGNVIELKNLIENLYFMVDNDKEYILPEDLPFEIREQASRNNRLKNHNVERENIINALLECDMDKTKAAKMLGYSRVTLWRKIIYFGINTEDIIK